MVVLREAKKTRYCGDISGELSVQCTRFIVNSAFEVTITHGFMV